MKITKVEAIPLRVPLKKPMTVSYGTLTAAETVVVKIYSDEGGIGIGETSALKGFYPESSPSIVHAVREIIGPSLIGENPFNVEKIITAIESLLPENICAKAAVDIALHDLVAKTLNIPLYQFLGGMCRSEITILEHDISVASPQEMAEEAAEAASAGITAFEIKVNGDLGQDLERVKAVREAVGAKANLRVDPNESYSFTFGQKVLPQMEEYDILYFEQPLPHWDYHGMAQLAKILRTPVSADQGAHSPHDVIRLIKMEAADIITIKIARTGFYKGKMIARVCEAAGIPCVLGSMLPLGFGTAAIHHFAISTKNLAVELCGVYASPLDFYTDDIVNEALVSDSGVVRVSDEPGLGVTPDPKKFERYCI